MYFTTAAICSFDNLVRDGRPWDRSQIESLVTTALYWQWMVRRGSTGGRKFPADYIAIRYEDLITNQRETLGRLGRFIDHDLDFDRIQRGPPPNDQIVTRFIVVKVQ